MILPTKMSQGAGHRRPSEPTIDLPPGARSPSYPGTPTQYDGAKNQLYTVATPPTPQLPSYDSGGLADFKPPDGGQYTEEPKSFYNPGAPEPVSAMMMSSPAPGPQNFVGQPQMPQPPYQVYQPPHQMSQHQQYQAPLPMTPPQMAQQQQQQQHQHSQIYQQQQQQAPTPHHQMSSPLPLSPGMQTSQPGPTMPMGFNPRNPKNMPVGLNGERDWSSGLCDCSNVGLCCLAWLCPCVVYGQIQTRLSYLTRNNRPHPSGGDSCGSDCMVHGTLAVCCGIGWVLQIGQRTTVRSRYRIGGNGCEDCLCAWCCTPCSLVQEAEEIDQEERALGQAAVSPMYVHDGKV